MKSDHTEGGLPSNLELTAENRLLFDRTLSTVNQNFEARQKKYNLSLKRRTEYDGNSFILIYISENTERHAKDNLTRATLEIFIQ